MKYKPFKMRGNPFKRNFGIGESPMKGYKSDAQRKAVHASKAEKSAMSMKHEGPMKAYHTAMKKHDGKTFDDAGFMDSHFPSGAPRSAAKMAHGKAPAKMAHGKKSAMKKRRKEADKTQVKKNGKGYYMIGDVKHWDRKIAKDEKPSLKRYKSKSKEEKKKARKQLAFDTLTKPIKAYHKVKDAAEKIGKYRV